MGSNHQATNLVFPIFFLWNFRSMTYEQLKKKTWYSLKDSEFAVPWFDPMSILIKCLFKTNVVNSFQHLQFARIGKRLGPICPKRSEIWGANSSGPSWFGIHGTRPITYLVILAGNERSWKEKRLPTFTSIEKQWSYCGFYFCNVSLACGCISMALRFIWILINKIQNLQFSAFQFLG